MRHYPDPRLGTVCLLLLFWELQFEDLKPTLGMNFSSAAVIWGILL